MRKTAIQLTEERLFSLKGESHGASEAESERLH